MLLLFHPKMSNVRFEKGSGEYRDHMARRMFTSLGHVDRMLNFPFRTIARAGDVEKKCLRHWRYSKGASIYDVHIMMGFFYTSWLFVRCNSAAFLDPLPLPRGRHIWTPPQTKARKGGSHVVHSSRDLGAIFGSAAFFGARGPLLAREPVKVG